MTALALIWVPSSVSNRNMPSSLADDTTFWQMNSAPKDLACPMPSERIESPSPAAPR